MSLFFPLQPSQRTGLNLSNWLGTDTEWAILDDLSADGSESVRSASETEMEGEPIEASPRQMNPGDSDASSDYQYHTGDEGGRPSVSDSEEDADVYFEAFAAQASGYRRDVNNEPHSAAAHEMKDNDEVLFAEPISSTLDGQDTLAASTDSSRNAFTEDFAGVVTASEPDNLDTLPDAVSASFRIAANMMLPDSTRQELLNAPNAVYRLR